MTISPLPQFEEDLASYLQEKEDRDAYNQLNAPTTIVVRFGYSRMVGEFPYDGDAKPGCGSKLVVKTHRGTEVGEMLTSTCKNSGCSKSVTRKEMLAYINNSGGRKYPFYEQGKVLRIATKQDLDDQHKLEQSKHALRTAARSQIKQHNLDMRLVEVEPLLGKERVIVYFNSEDRIDFRDLVKDLQYEFSTRVELLQVGARDEARIVADYERCGQYCCCKNFLKVLKPISMKSAKIQKATLDPLKISGRCGRLMCCLRYEDETYEELRKNLPHRKSRVGTPEGDGMVLDSQILTQLSKIRLDDGTIVAIPIEDLTTPEHATAPELPKRPEPRSTIRKEPRRSRRSEQTDQSNKPNQSESRSERSERRSRRRKRSTEPKSTTTESTTQSANSSDTPTTDRPKRRKKRQGGRRPRPADRAAEPNAAPNQSTAEPKSTDSPPPAPKKKRRRKRRRRGDSDGSDSSTTSNNE